MDNVLESAGRVKNRAVAGGAERDWDDLGETWSDQHQSSGGRGGYGWAGSQISGTPGLIVQSVWDEEERD